MQPRESFDRFIAFFEPQVLAVYRDQAHRYTVKTDLFDGEVSNSAEYFNSLTENQQAEEFISIRFGYRTLTNGDLKIAAFVPDLVGKSSRHAPLWQPHLAKDDSAWQSFEDDTRFYTWVMRYVYGERSGGPSAVDRLTQEIALINGVTYELIGCPLYKVEEPEIVFPAAQNTNSYEDAHRHLYPVLIDGLSRACIDSLADRLKRPVKAGDKKTLIALGQLLPAVDVPGFTDPMENISTQRRASHSVRGAARPMNAFAAFVNDIERCTDALRLVREALEKDLNVNAHQSRKRHDARPWLPSVATPAEHNHSVIRTLQMAGKTVERVEAGYRTPIEGLHQSEVILIHFTDGSIISIDTDTTARRAGIKPEELDVRYDVHWVPPR